MENSRYKVVLVDDNEAMLDQGKSILQSIYRVYTIKSAALLFEYLEYNLPDLILLDVEMPDMDGFETIERLKADSRFKDIPVIFLTVKSDEESERKGFSLGAVDYISKPFSGPLLQKRISNQVLYLRVQNAVKEYSSTLENKTRSLATMTVELRTSINSIIGFAELSLDTPEGAVSSTLKDYLLHILDNSKCSLHIINDILAMLMEEPE